jgi:predicted transcriptional regulator
MEYVEREAKKRAREVTGRYRQLAETEAYDQVILKVLKEAKEPLSVDLISFLTGINKTRCCQTLKRLEKKWDMVRKVTEVKTAYYELI